MSVGKLELVPKLAARIKRSAAAHAIGMSALDAWRVAHRAVELGTVESIRPRWGGGSSLGLSWLVNLTARRDDGETWELELPEHREELERLQARAEVELLLGSSSEGEEQQRLTEVYLRQL
eukprot:2186740-Amphidinium_carterae.1